MNIGFAADGPYFVQNEINKLHFIYLFPNQPQVS